MSVSEKDVRHIASLARLGVTDERVPTLVAELNRILGHMDVLQAVDLSQYEQHENQQGTPLRPDDSMPTQLQRPREEFAPAMRDGFFLVPRLDTHGSAGRMANDGSGTNASPTNDSSAIDGDEDES